MENQRYNPNIDTAYAVSEIVMSSNNITKLALNVIGVLAVAWFMSKAAGITYEVAFLFSTGMYLCSIPVRVLSFTTENKRLAHEERKWGYEELQQSHLALQQGTGKLKAKYLALQASSEQATQEIEQAKAKLSELEPKFKKAQSNVIHLSALLEQARQEIEQAGGNEEQARKQREQAAKQGYKQGVSDYQKLSKLKRSIPQLSNETDKAKATQEMEALKARMHQV